MRIVYNGLCIGIAMVAIISFSNCSKSPSCPESTTTTQDLTASALSKVPYTGYDTLHFLNKQGDTCIVRGTGKQYYYVTETVTTPPNCPDDYKRTQTYQIIFIAIQGELSFKLRHNYNIFIDVDMFKYQFEFFDETIGIGRGDIDSLQINGHTYYDIDSARLRLDGIMIEDDNSRCFFNKTDGVINLSDEINEYTLIK